MAVQGPSFQHNEEHFEGLPGVQGVRFTGGQPNHLAFLDCVGGPGESDFSLTFDDRHQHVKGSRVLAQALLGVKRKQRHRAVRCP